MKTTIASLNPKGCLIVQYDIARRLRSCVLCALLFLLCATSSSGDCQSNKDAITEPNAIFNELSAGLLRLGDRAISAVAELNYCQSHASRVIRKSTTTKEGRPAEVVFLSVPAWPFSDDGFSMAILFIDNQVVDSAACWTSNSMATAYLQLEDVDGDGIVDVAFRAHSVHGALIDDRIHGRPMDVRKWLYAYRITTHGFESIFPITESNSKVLWTCDSGIDRVAISVHGPSNLQEGRTAAYVLSIKNVSKRDLAIPAGNWFELDINSRNYTRFGPEEGKYTVLKPGASTSQLTTLIFKKASNDLIIIHVRFVPFRVAKD